MTAVKSDILTTIKKYRTAISIRELKNVLNNMSVRRVFPNLVVNEFIEVQPMTVPKEMNYFLDYVYMNNNKTS